MKITYLAGGGAAFALGMSMMFAAPAYAQPDQACFRPDGTTCPPMPPGCVQENGMPCSASLPDLNAACNQTPVVCRWLIGG